MAIYPIDYYNYLSGNTSVSTDTWYINFDKKYICNIYTDNDILVDSNKSMIITPSDSSESEITVFSDKTDQQFYNTKIEENGENEKVVLDLGKRITTFILDNSGSMTWNDVNGSRYELSKKIIDNIYNSYPGDMYYNLIKFGGDKINSLFFGVVDDGTFDIQNIDSIASLYESDEEANYSGIRIIRNEERSPQSHIDGDLVNDGYFSAILDEGLDSNTKYYYGIYTYDKNFKFSTGKFISLYPKNRNIPRGISVFRSFPVIGEQNQGICQVGKGVIRDNNSIGIWHMDEGKGNKLFDFSDNEIILSSDYDINWILSSFVPAGDYGIDLDGESEPIFYNDTDNKLEINGSNFTIAAWIFPADISIDQYFVSRVNSSGVDYALGFLSTGYLTVMVENQTASCSSLKIEFGKWQFVVCSYDKDSEIISFYINDERENVSFNNPSSEGFISDSSSVFYLGKYSDNYYRGKITELSIYNTNKDSEFVLSQLIETNITNEDGEKVSIEYTGRKEDNGDRLNIFEFMVPSDFDYVGGNIIIVKNSKNIPSWEEDGEIIYQGVSSEGTFYIEDADDFVIGEKYYYRIFSQNTDGIYSCSDDSGYLEFSIPEADTNLYFSDLTAFYPPQRVSYVNLITPGNKKVYLRWTQDNSVKDTMSRIKIYSSYTNYPIVDSSGGSDGELIFTGLYSDNYFVHKNVINNQTIYYTLVNVDKYGRCSNYTNDTQVYDFLNTATIPLSDADESIIPLDNIENLKYDLVDNQSISLRWDCPDKHAKNLEAYFDQNVFIFGLITDIFGIPISEDTLLKMYITPTITRDTQVDNVFSNTGNIAFEDKEAYSFSVTRSEDGYLKAFLGMTKNTNIISQIKEASFAIQMKVILSKNNYTEPNKTSNNISSLEEYYSGNTSTSDISSNIFEYYSETINVKFTNPWNVILSNRDSQYVNQRCYVAKSNKLSGLKYLDTVEEKFNGVYIRSSNPFIVRAKLYYKGEIVDSGSVNISVWDADSTQLCNNAGVENSQPYEGEKIKVSATVFPPNYVMSIVKGTEMVIGTDGEEESQDISYVDIPLKAPDNFQAARIYVKGERAGYSSTKSMYILFQSLLDIDINADSPDVDGKSISEQQATIAIKNPDYPNDTSLNIYPNDLSLVEWGINLIGNGSNRNIYSIEKNLKIENGVYSYTRNGVARNVFFGPIQKSTTTIDETHEIFAKINYDGMTAVAKQYVYLKYDPQKYQSTENRFLMEIDGKWKGEPFNQEWMISSWLSPLGNMLWADGADYIRVKVCRNPRIALTTDFLAIDCFKSCLELKKKDILQLDYGQVVQIISGDKDIEILYGEIYEVLDPYTGEYYLEKGGEGFESTNSASISLSEDEDINYTYCYIRANKFVPESGIVINSECDETNTINDCLCLNTSSYGLTECDLPHWSPVVYLSGKTILFFNNIPNTLIGGGTYENGLPPCPICLKEPLGLTTIWRKVKKFYYSKEFGEPSNDYLYPLIIEADSNYFMDADGVTLIENSSIVYIRVSVTWRGRSIVEGTPVYISIGNNDGNSVFKTDKNIYYTEYDNSNDYSYVDVIVAATKFPNEIIQEKLEIYSTYDKREKTTRKMSQIFYLTLDNSNNPIVEPPIIPVDNVSAIELPVDETLSPFSQTVERYDILGNKWDNTVSSISEKKGYMFSGIKDNNIFIFGGLKNNDHNISNKIEMYDINNDSWEDIGIINIPRFAGLSITYNNKIYLIGGIYANKDNGDNLEVSNLVESFDMVNQIWETLEPIPTIDSGTFYERSLKTAMSGGYLVEISNKNYIYIISGINDFSVASGNMIINKYNNRILRYCIEDNTWDYSDALLSNELLYYNRIFPSVIRDDNYIIVFNGIKIENGNFIYPINSFNILISENLSSTNDLWLIYDRQYIDKFPVPKYQSSVVNYNN